MMIRLLQNLLSILLLLSIHLVNAGESLVKPADLFSTTSNALKPGSLWLNKPKPYPTNAWFINFVLGQQNNVPSYPVNIFPYLILVDSAGISLSYKGPSFYAEPTYPDIISALFFPFDNQLTLGSQEPMTYQGVSTANNAPTMLHWKNKLGPSYQAPLLQGSPYVTEFFTHASPLLKTRFKIVSVNQQNTAGALPLANRYEIILAITPEKKQTWLLYTEHPINFTWEVTPKGETLKSAKPYNGWVRIALQKDESVDLNNEAQILDEYSQNIPLNYKRSYQKTDTQIIYFIEWLTQNNKPPLMLSLPHQREVNSPITKAASSLLYYGIKGMMLGETNSQWKIELPVPIISFLDDKKISPVQQETLKKVLAADVAALFKYPFPDDGPYRVGKRLARAAQLLVYADYLHAEELKKLLINFLEKNITYKMRNKGKWKLQYDTTWGGIIPSVDDYGARHYNDHHYHYGYWVYAFAVLAEFDPHWLNTHLSDSSFAPKEWVEMLIRDYANPYDADPYFPGQRYQDDYAGHSWASGLKAYADGQNQQSSSEAVNAYYAIALYAKAIHNEQLAIWAEFLTARELRSAQTYWQIPTTSTIYSAKFNQNNWVLGNLWGSKVDANTFFYPCTKSYRCGLEYTFGIQMLPLNAISTQLLDNEWLKQASPTIKKLIANGYGSIEDGWRWILIKGIAPIMTAEEKSYFLKKAIDSNTNEYDNGDSKTNTLYFLMGD